MDDSGSTSSTENSATSNGSSSSSDMDLIDDASSPISCFSSSPSISTGPLYDLSELMTQLPIKRGLSNYFQGKSQSFTSLSRVRSIRDLPKKETPYKRKMKACKSYHKPYMNLPKATISKKTGRSSLMSSSSKPCGRVGFVGTRASPFSIHNNLQC